MDEPHNYQKLLLTALDAGALDMAPGVHNMTVLHDGWCGVYSGERCNCNPELRQGTPTEIRAQAQAGQAAPLIAQYHGAPPRPPRPRTRRARREQKRRREAAKRGGGA